VPTKNYTVQYGCGRDQARSDGREKKLPAAPEKKLARHRRSKKLTAVAGEESGAGSTVAALLGSSPEIEEARSGRRRTRGGCGGSGGAPSRARDDGAWPGTRARGDGGERRAAEEETRAPSNWIEEEDNCSVKYPRGRLVPVRITNRD